ncbi:radical SAM/SPASM domain-containing protein [Allorhizobium borbori]|uniref:4Fe4S-binding SPASM domain-containing protein n=1 Tax=Allorhizobium borbori TaxID=485907 RepID=A0A7W6K6A8_9HYPH|nr:radical SAM/SPASM domain-containing protein [Allorhizobium borbori]MBB4106018.1 hypothetical protein [Allorhizobium borbori]
MKYSHFDKVSPRHLIEINDRNESMDLFRRSVTMIEVELFSYCNRRCWFCPNSYIDRISSNTHMSAHIYTSIISQLAEIDYFGVITYSRYNEPLADRIILERLAETRDLLPKAKLHANTNGDYLTIEYLAELYDAGMRSLNIQLYLKNREKYDHAKTIKRGEQTLRRLPLPYKVTIDQPGIWYEMELEYKDMKIRLYGRNFEENGTSRGDQVDIKRDFVRTLPCSQPVWGIYIDYNGKMVPCCNFRSDISEHASYVISDLNEYPDIFLSYSSSKAADFRRSMLTHERKSGPCSNCSFSLEELSAERKKKIEDVLGVQSRHLMDRI